MIGIIHYDMGNITSVLNACEFHKLAATIIQSPTELDDSITHIILPGVGSFRQGMNNLTQSGFAEVIVQKVTAGVPLLGICLGMQLLASYGDEGGETAGLGIVPGRVIRFPDSELRVPHVGWNSIVLAKENALITPDKGLDFYFVHSYYLVPEDVGDVIATCKYGVPFAAAVQKGNAYGVQFHPEKSFHAGLEILRRFASL